jgi:hypothetical protein
MPIFIGVHERLPRETTAQEVAEAHRADPEMPHGVRYLRYWTDEEAGKVFCLAEGPSAEAAAAAHREAHGLPVDRIYQVREGERPESSEHLGTIDRLHLGTIDREEAPMSAPFIFIGTHRIKEGKVEDFNKMFDAFCRDVVDPKEPRLLAFNAYSSEDGSEVSVVQVHPDADSMLFHMQVARQHIEHAIDELLDVGGFQIYGTPNEAVLGMIKELSGSGVPMSVKPLHLAGFTRLPA